MLDESVPRSDPAQPTGGNDPTPELYTDTNTAKLPKTDGAAPIERDLRELILIDEVFRQRKPLLGICRGHQLINVALGGTLVVDIRSEVPNALNHQRMDKKSEVVHEARLTGDSLLAKIAGKQTLGVNSTHHQAIGRVAEPLRVTATGRDGVVEAAEFRREAAHMLPFLMTMQYHPERLAPRHPEHQEMFNCFTRACILNRDCKL